MTDEAFTFKQTVAERSIQKNSAYHKKNGSATTKLGNKPMSWKEINSRHGECKCFDLGGFPSYSEFVEFPNDLKVEYINNLMDKYDIDLQHISRYLFNKGDDGIRSYLRNNKLLKLCDYQKPRAKTELLKFQSDIEEWRRREKAAKITDDAEAKRKRDIIWNAEFITYDELKKLPIDGQVNYINNLIRKYNVSVNALAKFLFKVDQTTFRRRYARANVYDQIEKSRSGNPTVAQQHIMEFEKAIKAWKGEEAMEQKPEETVVSVLESNKKVIEEACEKLNDIGEKYGAVTGADLTDALGIEYDPNLVIPYEPAPSIKTAVQTTSEMAFSANYISDTGLDEHQLYALITLFGNKKVKVEINIEVLES